MNDQDWLRKTLATIPILNEIVEPVATYLLLLQQWNRAYNLTAIRDLDAMIVRHILDSLAILPWIHGSRVLDVGTGAGLPGIPVLLARPDLFVTLLDSNGKKIRFLQEVKRVLGLNNLELIHSRVEQYHDTLGFDTVCTRAFSSLQQMIDKTQHLLAPNSQWLAMKGLSPVDELANIHYPYSVKKYSVEGLEGERCCVIISNTFKE